MHHVIKNKSHLNIKISNMSKSIKKNEAGIRLELTLNINVMMI